MGFFGKISSGLKKTKDAIANKIADIFGKGELTDDFYDELEAILLSADVGVEASGKIIDDLRKKAKKAHIKTVEEVKQSLRESIAEILAYEKEEISYPVIYTIIGVNGVGKTTAIGKLAHKFVSEGKNVVLAAADTFRAAASAQLAEWASRAKARIVKYGEGADPGAVVYDAIASAKAKGTDVLLVDTAGRLHNKVNLMTELSKIGKIIEKGWEEATKKTLLVLDASIGQNSLSQVEVFNSVMPIDGIILTKLDGTSKGGVVLNIKEKYNINVLYAGVGEKLDDIVEFDPVEFANGII